MEEGMLKINNEGDRVDVASKLFKNGYAVETVRKKNGKSFEYYIKYRYVGKGVNMDGEGSPDCS